MEAQLLKERVQNILLKYDATKIKTADTLISSFDAKESALMAALSRKYGPEPTDATEVSELRKKHGLPPPTPPSSSVPKAPSRNSTPKRGADHVEDEGAGSPAPKPPPPLSPAGSKKAPPAAPSSKVGVAGQSPARGATPPRVPAKQPADSRDGSVPSGRKGTPTNAPVKAPPPPAPTKKTSPAPAAKQSPSTPARKGTPTGKAPPSPPAPTKKSPSPHRKDAPASPPRKGTTPKAQGPPPGISEASWRESIELEAQIEVLRNMYETHAPEKVGDVENVLENHAHELDDLMQAMENKYRLPPGSLKEQIDNIIAERTGGTRAPPPANVGGGTGASTTPAPSSLEGVPAESSASSSPQQLRRISSKNVQETSKQLVQEVIEEFFDDNAPERTAQVAGLMQQYEGRHNELFASLQQEFSKPAGFFKGLLNTKSKAAADELVRQGSYVGKKKKRGGDDKATTGGASSSPGSSGKNTAGASAKDSLWRSIDEQSSSSSSSRLCTGPNGRVFTFREQLEYFCDKYCPPKAAAIGKALRVYHGRELELIQALHDTYGVHGGEEYLPLAGTDGDLPSPPPPPPEERASSPALPTTGKKGKGKANAVQSSVTPVPSSPAGGSIGSTALPDRIPEDMRNAAELARHFGLGPQFVPRVMEQYGREDSRRVMFEVIASIFPDAVSHALANDEQRIAFAARRVSHFLSFHHPTAKGAVGRIVAQYAETGRLDEALGDLLIRYYGQMISEVPLKAFEANDLLSGVPSQQQPLQAGSPNSLSRIFSSVDIHNSPSLSRMESTANITGGFGEGADGENDSAAAQLVLRRREFRRSVDDWARQYGGSSNVSRSTPRALGRMGDMYSVGTSSADLPRDVVNVASTTFHREQEEARLLGLVERGMVTEPFNFEIRSYQDRLDKQRRSFGGGDDQTMLRDMRQERHRDIYGHSSQDLSTAIRQEDQRRTLLPNPMIFLEDDDCPKCRVLQHQLETATQRLHSVRVQQQYRDRVQAFETMERRAAEDALITNARAGRGLPRFGLLDDTCASCEQLRQQVQNLSARLHTLRSRPPPSLTSDDPKEQQQTSLLLLQQRSTNNSNGGDHYGLVGSRRRENTTSAHSLGAVSLRDTASNTDLDSKKFSDLRSYFILEAL